MAALAIDARLLPQWRRQHDGWDGNSDPKYVLIAPCGCRWTNDGSALLHVSSTCIGRPSGHTGPHILEAVAA